MASAVVSDNFETSTGTIPQLGGADVTTRLCAAWVNFNGIGTVAIRGSYNVSSITDHGTGDYTTNFTTALADGNYSQAVNAGVSGATIGLDVGNLAYAAPTASAFRWCARNSSSGAAIDPTYVSVQIFR